MNDLIYSSQQSYEVDSITFHTMDQETVQRNDLLRVTTLVSDRAGLPAARGRKHIAFNL